MSLWCIRATGPKISGKVPFAMPPLTPAEIDHLWLLIRANLPSSFTRDDFDRTPRDQKPDSPFHVTIEKLHIEVTLANSFISFDRFR